MGYGGEKVKKSRRPISGCMRPYGSGRPQAARGPHDYGSLQPEIIILISALRKKMSIRISESAVQLRFILSCLRLIVQDLPITKYI
jgi:hypothetical protein